jgi:hypothetical protein
MKTKLCGKHNHHINLKLEGRIVVDRLNFDGENFVAQI